MSGPPPAPTFDLPMEATVRVTPEKALSSIAQQLRDAAAKLKARGSAVNKPIVEAKAAVLEPTAELLQIPTQQELNKWALHEFDRIREKTFPKTRRVAVPPEKGVVLEWQQAKSALRPL